MEAKLAKPDQGIGHDIGRSEAVEGDFFAIAFGQIAKAEHEGFPGMDRMAWVSGFRSPWPWLGEALRSM